MTKKLVDLYDFPTVQKKLCMGMPIIQKTFSPIRKKNKKTCALIFNIAPFKIKTCSSNCSFCQYDSTINLTTERKEYFSTDYIIGEFKKYLESHPKDEEISYITLVASGEHSILSNLKEIITELKKLIDCDCKIVHCTNGYQMDNKDFLDDLEDIDMIVPSFVAATQSVFTSITRNKQLGPINKIIDGLKELKKSGVEMLMEVILVKNVNDSKEELKAMKQALHSINPDKILLNTVYRPPANKNIKGLTFDELKNLDKYFDLNSELALP